MSEEKPDRIFAFVFRIGGTVTEFCDDLLSAALALDRDMIEHLLGPRYLMVSKAAFISALTRCTTSRAQMVRERVCVEIGGNGRFAVERIVEGAWISEEEELIGNQRIQRAVAECAGII